MKTIFLEALATLFMVSIVFLLVSPSVVSGGDTPKVESIGDITSLIFSQYNVNVYDESQLKNLEQVVITAILDGDTVSVKGLGGGEERQVRLLGIDTNEVMTVDTHEHCLGAKATIMMTLLLGESRIAYLEPDITNRDTDDIGRLLRYVYVQNPLIGNNTYIDLSEALVALGYARVFEEYPALRKELYMQRAQEAKEKNMLLAGQC